MSATFFDLMKYAATGIAAPSMTHFDKMRALSMTGGLSVQSITGVPPISFTGNGKPLKSVDIFGNTQQTGTPSPDNIIMPTFCGARTDNLVPPLTEWVNGYISGTNGEVVNPSVTYKEKTSAFLEIPNNVTIVTFSSQDGGFEAGTSGAWRAIGFYDSNKKFVSRLGGNGVNAMSVSISEGARFMRVSCRTYGSDKEYMLNSGTALPYEPYGYKIPITCAGQTVPVYLGQTQTVRRVKKLVLNGTENWIFFSNIIGQYGAWQFYIDNAAQGSGSISALSNIAPYGVTALTRGDNMYGCYLAGGGVSVCFQMAGAKDTFANIALWKSYLASQYAAGTPVTVWYVLAEPETAIVNEPLAKIGDYADELSSTIPIPTVKGANVLTVDTTLPPSSMTITGNIK